MSDFTKEEKAVLRTKTPKSYVDKSIKNSIPGSRKASLTREWLKKNDFTIEDIQKARAENPILKAERVAGSRDRNDRRSEIHNYSKSNPVEWTKDMIMEFVDLNKKNKQGYYLTKDWELAKHFKCSIPAVQHLRRKYNMSLKVIDAKFGKVTKKRLVDHMLLGEKALRKLVKKI